MPTLAPSSTNLGESRFFIIISAKEVMFLPEFVCLSVCVSADKGTRCQYAKYGNGVGGGLRSLSAFLV